MKVNFITTAATFKPLAQPTISVTSIWKKLKATSMLLLESFPVSYSPSRFKAPTLKFSLAKLRGNRQLSRFALIGLVAILLAGLGIFLATQSRSSSFSGNQKKVDKTFSVLARDKNGNSINKYINFHITDVQKVTTVLVQGQTLRARDGKEFLLVNFDTDNTTKTVFYLNPTDLVRYLRNDGKKFAPTVYQGILEIRPDSTKNSNIGFVIEPKDQNFKLEIGDLDSQKQNLEVKF